MAVKVLPYRQGSRSARALADALGGRVLRLEGSRYVERNQDIVVNWGRSGDIPYRSVLNSAAAVRTAGNKLFAFTAMRDNCRTPEWWVRREEIPDDAFPIVCRTTLTGHSGAGIVMAQRRSDLVDAPLYVRYVKKQDEYRIHVGRMRGEYIIISIQRKAKRAGFEGANFQIRNHDNGFVYVRDGVNPPEDVIQQARDALEACGLDFGAVDVIWNNHRREAYVLEINTAPGLEGTTIEHYAQFFRRAMDAR